MEKTSSNLRSKIIFLILLCSDFIYTEYILLIEHVLIQHEHTLGFQKSNTFSIFFVSKFSVLTDWE